MHMNRKGIGKKKRSRFAEDLIENLPIGIMLLDRHEKIIRMNKKQEEASQINRERILGKTFPEAFPRTLEQGLKRPYLNLLRHKKPFDIIIDHYIPQYYSKQITYRARGASFSSGEYFILLHEHAEALYHEKRLVEKKSEELEKSKKFLESLIDSSPNMVVSADLTGRILSFNRKAEETFGYKEEEMIKKKIGFLFKEPLFDEGEYRKDSPAHPEVVCVKKDQIPFTASLRISDIRNTTGKPIAILYLLADLTERKEMEERLLLSEKLALYSELMGGIAHQLNNPLIGVVNFSEMLSKEMKDEDPKRELAETISKAGKECLKIITSVLSCIDAPHLTFSKTNVNAVLVDALDTSREQFGEQWHDITLILKVDPSIPTIWGDSIQLKQCFLNILANAIQAMQNGKGCLKVGIEYDERKKEVKILFSDNGRGIPREYITKIFLPFFSLKKAPEGRGLGLSFAYQIVKNHGGHIRVESELGKGSMFTLVLPAS
jgi:PAS domain S-box-containing protein